MSATIQLSAGPGKIVSQTVRRVNRLRASGGTSAIVLLLLLILGGCKKRQITTPTVQMDIKPEFWIRVLLLDDVTTCTLKTTSAFGVVNDQTALPAQITENRFDQTNAPISLELVNGRIAIDGKTFADEKIVISPDDPSIFNLDGNDYRGKLKLIVNPGGNTFDAINLLPPEPYLAGVVGAEMPDYWEPEALKAQAIAARTYCFYVKKQFGANREWDMKQTAAHQVYRGVSAESLQIWQAVNETKGQVVSCKQSEGPVDIFPSYYSSTCGGHTENSKNVFGDSFEPLNGVPCPYCQDVAKPKFFFWPTIQFDKAYVTERLLLRYPQLEQLGKIAEIVIAGRTDYGEFTRLTRIKLIGSTGKTDSLRAEDFRLAVDPTGRKLRSTICQIMELHGKWAFLSGRGWGHGVGMCQCGAQGMAREGKNAQQILSYYYPDSTIISIY